MILIRLLKRLLAGLLRLISDVYERVVNPYPPVTPEETGWSVVITTTGCDQTALNILLDSVHRELHDSTYEIILVGPKVNLLPYKQDNVRVIPYRELHNSLVPGWITRKKNIGVRAAKYNKLVVCHDYIVFSPGWKKGYDILGENFEAASNIFINKNGKRHKDWITYDYPGVGQGLLPYHVNQTKYQYLNGAYFVIKRALYLQEPLNERLRWGESEDIEWSKRLRRRVLFTLNQNSEITYSKLKPDNSPLWEENTKKLELLFGKNNL